MHSISEVFFRFTSIDLLIKMFRFLFLTILCFQIVICQAQITEEGDYVKLYQQWDVLEKGDTLAFQYIQPYLKKAQESKDWEKLHFAYSESVYYCNSRDAKLLYADSSIIAAQKSYDEKLLASAYLGKGIVYHFNFKKYRAALQNYLTAYDLSKKIKDDYLEYKITYHMGVVKSYLGEYESALQDFQSCLRYFEKELKSNKHPNLIYGFKKGYLNSLHQSIICYRYLKQTSKIGTLIDLGIEQSINSEDYRLEYAYFLKCKGINNYQLKDYNSSIQQLEESIGEIEDNGDLFWLSIVYYYLGKNYESIENFEKAQFYFTKVDGIVDEEHFYFPELRDNYHSLKKLSLNEGQVRSLEQKIRELDSLDLKEYKILSPIVHQKYDQEKMASQNRRLVSLNYIFASILALITIILVYVYFLKMLRHRNRYWRLIQFWLHKRKRSKKEEYQNEHLLDTQLREELYLKLLKFEASKAYAKPKVNAQVVAKILGTNINYLSKLIKETRGCSFSHYLADLRIRYIVELINTEKKYLNYTIDSLAEECGIASRQNFSNLFLKITGKKPVEYIKERKKELQLKEDKE